MKHIIKFEAIQTECQTPDAIFNINIDKNEITCNVKLPFDINLNEEEAKILEANIHNSMEVILSKYFK